MRPGSKTLAFSSIFLSLVVCFVALVHVEVELHAHRQMLQVLSQQRADNFEPRKTVHEPITSSFHSDSVEGKLRVSYFISYSLTETWRRVRFALILSSVAISIALPMLVCKIWWLNKCDKKHLEDEETERKQKKQLWVEVSQLFLSETEASEDMAPQCRKILQRFVHVWCPIQQ